MRRCAKCGGRVLCEQEVVATGEKLICCYVCRNESKPMPFMFLARIEWNRENRRIQNERDRKSRATAE